MNQQVTWLLPVKNGMPYIRETLASIEAQTYRNWEILAWDNGSTDGTREELHQWIPARLPGRVVDDQPLSLGESLARLVEVAQTEFCARIDADDLNYPQRLEEQVGFLQSHKEVGIVGTNIEFIDERGQVFPGAWQQPSRDADIRWKLRWACPLNHPTVLFRRSVVLAAGNYAHYRYEDYDLWMRLARIAEMANLPRVLVKYRILPTSFTSVVGARDGAGWIFDEVAKHNQDSLFGGMSGPAALELRQKAAAESQQPLALRDLIKFRRAAIATAREAGKPADYFRATNQYAQQLIGLRGRWLQQSAWGRASLSVKRSLQARVRKLSAS